MKKLEIFIYIIYLKKYSFIYVFYSINEKFDLRKADKLF